MAERAEEFLPRKAFEGAKPGYVFTTRGNGLGYYLDTPAVATHSGSFIPSQQWTGQKDGYVFKMGDDGLGYYKDVPLPHRAPATSSTKKSAPGKVVIKSNRAIAKIPLPTANEAKRRKVESADQDKPHYIKEMERYRSQSCSSDTKHERPLVK